MTQATARQVLLKDAEFLGMNFRDFVEFVGANPLAQTQRTLAAYRVYVG
jgi:hypothetical protein